MNEIWGEDTFKIRLAIAVVLLLLVMLFDISGRNFVGIPMNALYRAIATDYGTLIENSL